MLKVAGELSGSTNTWMVGPKAMSAHVIPALAIMVTATLLVFLLPHLARQCIATTFFLGGALGSPSFADLRAIGLPRMEGVLISESREGEYARTLQSGVALLRDQGVRNETLMTLDFSNPFPALLDLPPALGDPWCMHVGRHISLETALPGEQLFADAAYIMIPSYWRERETRDFLLGVYGGYLDEVYRVVAENGGRRLLRRGKGCLGWNWLVD